MTCSCGSSTTHIVMSRRTYDNIIVELDSTGAVTGCLGYGLKGVPVVRPKTPEAVQKALTAGRLFLGEVCLYNQDDLGPLYAACRWAAERDGLPGTVRDRLKAQKTPNYRPSWTVVEMNRDGAAKERYWRLPRLLMAGTVIWDFMNRQDRYEIMYTIQGSNGETVAPSGIKFATLDEVSAFIRSKT